MFNRIARFALCLALISLSACAGASRQTHGTAQRQNPLLAELIIIGALADGAGGGDSNYDDDDGGSNGGAMVVAVSTIAVAAGIAYLVFKNSGDVDGVEAVPEPFNSLNNVSAAPDFIQAAQRGAF